MSAPYERVAAALRADIAAGRLTPGDRVESERRLAARFSAAPMTVGRAIGLLREEGLLYTAGRRGTFVHRNASARPARAAAALGSPALRVQALVACLEEIHEQHSGGHWCGAGGWHGYPGTVAPCREAALAALHLRLLEAHCGYYGDGPDGELPVPVVTFLAELYRL